MQKGKLAKTKSCTFEDQSQAPQKPIEKQNA